MVEPSKSKLITWAWMGKKIKNVDNPIWGVSDPFLQFYKKVGEEYKFVK